MGFRNRRFRTTSYSKVNGKYIYIYIKEMVKCEIGGLEAKK